MDVKSFLEIVQGEFYAGVPDSCLKALCDYLFYEYGIDRRHHLIAANEGNAAALAAGYYLATGKIPVVYMQNSGLGNIVNPVTSLLNEKVYGIPAIFIIGWRGEPGMTDEPQHIFQGEITLNLLHDLGIEYAVVDANSSADEIRSRMADFREYVSGGKSAAFVIRKGALQFDIPVSYDNKNRLLRESVIEHIVEASGSDPVISTTGKASRELYEIRERRGQGHSHDFLTVGAMGHASSIAVGIAIQKNTRVWCIDGDGAMLMHMGAVAHTGSYTPANFIHIVINNEAHESVGGMPTVAGNIKICDIARACGYKSAVLAEDLAALDEALSEAKASDGPHMIEVRCSLGEGKCLGRPSALKQNMQAFMNYLKDK